MTSTMHMDRADKNKVGTVEIEDLRVIPVIFLPGVMGSNLMDKKGKSIWRYDDSMSLMGWSLPTSGPKERKRLLHPDRVEVDNRGRIPAPPDAQEKLIQLGQQYPEDPSDKEAMDNYTQAVRDILDNIEPEAKLFGSRKDRGWGVNRPGFPGECFICELRLPDHRFRWKHNKLFLLLPEEYGPAFPAIVDCYTSPPT